MKVRELKKTLGGVPGDAVIVIYNWEMDHYYELERVIMGVIKKDGEFRNKEWARKHKREYVPAVEMEFFQGATCA